MVRGRGEGQREETQGRDIGAETCMRRRKEIEGNRHRGRKRQREETKGKRQREETKGKRQRRRDIGGDIIETDG